MSDTPSRGFFFGNMPSNWRAAREIAQRRGLLSIFTMIFFVLVMFLDDDPPLLIIYLTYYIIVLMFALTFSWREIKVLGRSNILWLCGAFLFYLALTPIWTGGMIFANWLGLWIRSVEVLSCAAIVAAMVFYRTKFISQIPTVIALASIAIAVFSIARFLVYLTQTSGIRLMTYPWTNENTGPSLLGLIVCGLLFYSSKSMQAQPTITEYPVASVGTRIVSASDDNQIPLLKPFVQQVICYTATAILFLDVVLASTRAALIGIGLAALAFFAIAVFKKFSLRRRAILALALVVLIGLALIITHITQVSLFRGYSQRDKLLVGYWDLAYQHFWIGHGMENEGKYAVEDQVAPHNQTLTALLYGGFVAAALYLAMYFTMLYYGLVYYFKKANFALVAMTLFLLAHGFFETVILATIPSWRWLYLWVPVGIAAGLELSLTQTARMKKSNHYLERERS